MVEYVQLVSKLPRPSAQQIESFVEYVAEAHSWYKHLPPTPPGVPFFFFTDPNAGSDLLLEPSGIAKYRERTESTPHLHYNWRPTDEYRHTFGYLQFFTPAGTWILVGEVDGVVCSRIPGAAVFAGSRPRGLAWGKVLATLLRRGRPVAVSEEVRRGESVMKSYKPPVEFFLDEGWTYIPEEILRAGQIELTRLIHPYSSQPQLWKDCLGSTGGEGLQWPEESGGRSTLERIVKIAQYPSDDAKMELERVLEPERRRQKQLMRLAIERVLDLIYPCV